jgi:hypothetical protein
LVLVDEHLVLLEAHRDALVHFEVFFQTIVDTSVLCVQDFSSRKVADAVVEAELGYFVKLFDELF